MATSHPPDLEWSPAHPVDNLVTVHVGGVLKDILATKATPSSTTVLEMSDYDAIVVGAGHNGLTAAAVMARGGMRVLCLEKNHFIGGMSSNTELIRGYHFELAGSIQFPVPNEIFEDLGFDECPIYEPEVQSASIGSSGEPPTSALLRPRAAPGAPR